MSETDVAIVGMSGRFPGAPDPDALWRRVVAGEDCLVDLPVTDSHRGHRVFRAGIVDDVENFDPEFFGIGKRDAAIMDPQQRLFLECVWEALESAGHVPERFAGSIGLFGGAGANTYLLNNVLTNPDLVERLGWFLLRHTGNDKDFLTTTASYRFDLRGPSINVQTACSTSLVAVHLAVQSLVGFECDLALAGGVTLEFPHGSSYEYREGEILSPNGRCRAFDAESDGTVLTGGAAVVALRRLSDALDEGDNILAVVKGSAVNNDGARKVGYLAPSVEGHADVIREALTVADVDASSITLFEAHGTGTAVGDPIEAAAMIEAFGPTDRPGYCRITSTKPNIGHLDTAAGTASLIKVVQALQHRTLPPLANHTAANPLLDLAGSPFVLSGTAAPWAAAGPRRAGVSSLGVGGTNAHVIVEEAPLQPPLSASGDGQLLMLSALTDRALDEATERLAAFLASAVDIDLADVAHTLAAGRRTMPHRRVVAVTDLSTAPDELRAASPRRRPSAVAADRRPRIVFGFPGGGSQYPGMGAGLDDRFEVFHDTRRAAIDAALVAGADLTDLFGAERSATDLMAPTASLPAVFITSVALARQWMAWGVEPDAMIGHSLGEYVAAHLAGVLSLADAMTLVVVRSRLMERASGDAAMLVVPLGSHEIEGILPDEISLATVNADDECVVAGRSEAITDFASTLDGKGVETVRLPLAAAAHSALLDPVLAEFRSAVDAVTLHAPQRPYVSNLTGTFISASRATDPQYWVDHLRGTVQLASGLRTALANDGHESVLVEIGPGHTLTSNARRTGLTTRTIATMRHVDDRITDTNHALTAFGELWIHGVDIDIDRFTGANRRRVRLPTYPFQRERCWIEPGSRYRGTDALSGSVDPVEPVLPPTNTSPIRRAPQRIASIDDMALVPHWVATDDTASIHPIHDWTVVGTGPTAAAVIAELRRRGRAVDQVAHSSELAGWPAIASRALAVVDDPVFDDAGIDNAGIDNAGADDPVAATYDSAVELWLGRVPPAIDALVSATATRARFVAVTHGSIGVDGPARRPASALAHGAVLVAPREYPHLETALVDVEAPSGAAVDNIGPIVDAIEAGDGLQPVRDGRRLTASYDPAHAADLAGGGIIAGGTYVVTGGLGGIGGAVAGHLATQHGVRLAILSSDVIPSAADRDRFERTHGFDHPTVRRIRRLAALERQSPAVVVVTADLADPGAVRASLDQIERELGPIDGVVHAAGRLRDRLMVAANVDDHRHVADPKAGAALTLLSALSERAVPNLFLVSSTSTIVAPPGQMSYVAANAVLDSLAGQHGGTAVHTIGFGMWASTGMASDAARKQQLGIVDGETIDHPVLDTMSTDHRGRSTVTGRLVATHHWVIDEHRTVSGVAVLPGTGHMELMVAAARASGVADVQLDDLVLYLPVVADDERAVTVRLVIDPRVDGASTIRLDSDQGHGRGWVTHSEAVLRDAQRQPETIDIAAIEMRCAERPASPLRSAAAHLRLGEHWDSVATGSRNERESIGYITLGAHHAAESQAWHAHPALMDIATGFGIDLDADERLHVPIGYERVEVFGRVPASVIVHATLLSEPGDEIVRADVTLATTDGTEVVHITGLQLRALDDTAIGSTPEARTADPATSAGSLLALTDELGLTPGEGVAWFDRFASSEVPRLIVSSLTVTDLLDAASVDTPASDVASSAAEPEAAGTRSVESELSAMWSELLGVSDIALDDDFFDLGGHSLIAIRVMSAIKQRFGVRLQLATIFEAPTVSSLATRIRVERPDVDAHPGHSGPTGGEPSGDGRHLVAITTQGSGRPFFVVHGAGGNVLFLWSLARALGGERPIYGFQAHGVNHGEMPDPTVTAMATRYVRELLAHGPGPYLLGGYSGGGIITLEMVRQLQELGEVVDHVVLFDSVPSEIGPNTFVNRWKNVTGHAGEQGIRSVRTFVRQRLVESVRRFVPERRERQIEHALNDRALGYTDVANQGYVDLYHYLSATLAAHRTGRYDIDATVLKADLVWPELPADYHWTTHISGTLDWKHVPGDHHSMFYPENAPSLASAVSLALAPFDDVEASVEAVGVER